MTQNPSILRGQNLGQQMIEFAINWGFDHGATIIQLITNKERSDAIKAGI